MHDFGISQFSFTFCSVQQFNVNMSVRGVGWVGGLVGRGGGSKSAFCLIFVCRGCGSSVFKSKMSQPAAGGALAVGCFYSTCSFLLDLQCLTVTVASPFTLKLPGSRAEQ